MRATRRTLALFGVLLGLATAACSGGDGAGGGGAGSAGDAATAGGAGGGSGSGGNGGGAGGDTGGSGGASGGTGGGGGTGGIGGTGGLDAGGAGGTGGVAGAGGSGGGDGGGTGGASGGTGGGGAASMDAGDSATGGALGDSGPDAIVVDSGPVCTTQADCDDLDACNGAEDCVEGACVPGTAKDCDDQNSCTEDACEPTSGDCTHTALTGTTCDDGNACTDSDVCDALGACGGVDQSSSCEDGNPCTDNVCDPLSGCLGPTNNTATCDDNDLCTTADVCSGGSCSGTPVLCNDDEQCTTDSCNPADGTCVYDAVPLNGTSCDDGSQCTVGETCIGGTCAGGGNVTCDDGEQCTDNTCDPLAGCLYPELAGPCNDGNACTTNDTCSGGSCVGGAARDCDDGNPCTTETCIAPNGCSYTEVADDTPCPADANVCTYDVCKSGACNTNMPNTTQCGAPTCSGDPAVATPAALCDGSGTCQTPTPVSCGTDPCNQAGTACQGDCGTDTDCPTGYYCAAPDCLSKGGNGDPCTADNMCTSGFCADGVCCDTACGGSDPNDCFACNVTAGTCTIQAAAACEDGDACTLGDTCSAAGVCVSGADKDCADTNPCTADFCDAAGNCQHDVVPDGTTCDDGNVCTLNDACTAGVCGGTQKTCDDGKVCTDDWCDPIADCQVQDNTAPCDDNNECTVADTCAAGSCVPGSPRDCNDGNPCTTDLCLSATGCDPQPLPDDTACPGDGSPCTYDVCKAGVCNAPMPNTQQCGDPTCSGDPAVAIPAAFCDGSGSCVTPSPVLCGTDPCNQAGTACQGPCLLDTDCPSGYFCSANSCVAKSPDGDPCTADNMCTSGFCADGVCCNTACGGSDPNDCVACNVTPGTCTIQTGATCEDGDLCTVGETCDTAGVCGPGTQKDCADTNPCTADSCDLAGNCQHDVLPDGTTCEDNDACTENDACQAGTCSGSTKDCTDTNECTDNWCDPVEGCKVANNTAFCDDNDACTIGEVCSNGACGGGTPLACDDGVNCNGVETCAPASGCVQGTPVVCADDGFSCTVEFCDALTDACKSQPQNTNCDNQLFCDGVETCDPTDPSHDPAGCVAGTAPPCIDNVPCTTDGQCDETNDVCVFPPDDSFCNTDNDVCDGIESCDPANFAADANGCIAGTPLACDDGVLCTDNACDPIAGCQYTANNALCDNTLHCDGVETCEPANLGADSNGCVDNADPTCPATDSVPCTQDVCDEATDGCMVVFDSTVCTGGETCTAVGCGEPCTSDADCDDQARCNGVEYCDLSGGSPGKCKIDPAQQAVVCSDGVTCTTDTCTEPTGTCTYTPVNTACNDNNACTMDTCDAGSGCQYATLSCDDSIPCTLDLCQNSLGGCFHINSTAACDNGVACDGAEQCAPTNPSADADGCVAGSPVICSDADGIACTTETCSEAQGGCVATPDNSLCPCGQTCDSVTGCGNYCVVSTCQGVVYACGDCVDNDGDCGIDSLSDGHCLGPCSDNESGFKGEISGQDHGNCDADCYFDKDNGSGNDQCFWSHDCDPLSLVSATPPYTPSGSNKCDFSNNSASQNATCDDWFATQSTTCWDPTATPPLPGQTVTTNYCGFLVPNGCDCFGCCVIPGAPTPVFLGSRPDANDPGTCTLSTLGDPNLCKPCTQVPSCLNPCETCEVCVGKPELPPECLCQQCAPGEQLCGAPCGTPCPAGYFCKTGCCTPNPG